jgi:hypothetical protein
MTLTVSASTHPRGDVKPVTSIRKTTRPSKYNSHFSSETPASHEYHPAQLTEQHESATETIHASIHLYLSKPATTSHFLSMRTAAPIEKDPSIGKHKTTIGAG